MPCKGMKGKNHEKRVFTVLLSLALLFSAIGLSASAASNSNVNFGNGKVLNLTGVNDFFDDSVVSVSVNDFNSADVNSYVDYRAPLLTAVEHGQAFHVAKIQSQF